MNEAAQPSSLAAGAYGVSAGLDLLSGVFGFLAAGQAASVARSRADLVRMEAEANAQRYAEQAEQFRAYQSVMYLASGVTLAGTPVDVLASEAQRAHSDIAAIHMAGEREALGSEVEVVDERMQGRDALVRGIDRGVGFGLRGYDALHPQNGTNLGVVAQLLGGGNP